MVEIKTSDWSDLRQESSNENKTPDVPDSDSTDSVGPYVISCQMFVKSEFPLDYALLCDSDQKKLGWHFFRKL